VALTHHVKRKSKPRPQAPQARGEPVVRGVMEATMAELAGTGYNALRIEDVAARARVNKTTVYRRWPTKEELVRAALLSVTSGRFGPPETGSLRTDMLAMARNMVSVIGSCEGQGLFRLVLAAGPDSELMAIARSLKAAHEAVPRAVLEAAAARGELVPGVDAMLLVSALVATVKERLFTDREAVDESFLVRLVDLLLYGAMPDCQRPACRPSADDAPPPSKVQALSMGALPPNPRAEAPEAPVATATAAVPPSAALPSPSPISPPLRVARTRR
jgi:AcrR family transcriptional regulator